MNSFQIFHLWNEYRDIGNITRKLNKIKNKNCISELRQNIKTMHRKMFLVLILSILSVIILFFYSLGALKTSMYIDFYQQDIMNKDGLDQNDKELYVFSKYEYLNKTQKPYENVIAFLVPSFSGDVRLAFNPYPRLREKILQLDERLDDNYTADIIIFHTGYPFRGDIIPIIEGSRRQVEFVNIDHLFHKFSPGFDPHIRDPSWSQKGKWNYHHMCYFWFKQVFELKIIQRYKYMMRLDDDSQILGKWPNVFDLMVKHQALYMANQRELDYEYVLPGLSLARNLTAAYIIQNNIIVRNRDMLADVFNSTWDIPNYWNNFEIVDLSFMRRKEVVDFIQAIDESRGIFVYRWGDAPLRYIIIAVFVNATQVLHRVKLGFGYCHPC